jgi:hypothetical protein
MSGRLEDLIEEMIAGQRTRLLEIAQRIDPEITPEDLLQPHDHAKLATHPDFHFEDGILAGYLAVRAALRAKR